MTCKEILKRIDDKRTTINVLKRDMGGINPKLSTYAKINEELKYHEHELTKLLLIKDGVCS